MSRSSGGVGGHGRRLLLVIALAAASVLVLCGPAVAESTPSPGGTVTLRIGWVQEPDNLNPFIGIQGTSYMLWHMNYDFLVGFDAETLEPRPELATSWEVSEDGKDWTFTIRDDATWQDGTPVTAADVAFTFNYINENELLNLSAYTDGITGADVIDDTHVVVHTRAPKANMLRMVVPILPEHIWSKIDGEAAASSYQNKPPVIGDGPFQIVEFKKGKYVRLVANETYWAGAPKVDEIIFQLYTNADTMAQDLKLGTIDGAVNVPPAQFKQLGDTPGIETVQGTSWQFTEIGMNCYDDPDSKGNPVLLDQQFRQAVNWAVDREKIVAVAHNGYAAVGSTLIVPYSEYHWEPPAEAAYTYDPEKAAQLLDDAGYRDVDGDGLRETKDGEPLSLRFYVTADAPENQTAAKLIVGWLNDIGVKLELQVLDAGALIDAQYNYEGDDYAPDWDLFIWYWTQDVDPQFMLGIYTPQQIEGWNDCLWTDEEYTELNDAQAKAIDVAERKPIVERMQEIFSAGAAYAILTYPYQLEAYDSDDWQGWVSVPGNTTGGQEGAVLYSYNNIDTYRLVEPKTATTTAESSNTTTIVVIVVVAAVVVAALAALLLRRRGGRTETE